MRKPELAEAIARQTGLTKEKSSEVVTAFVDTVTDALAEGESVTLIGFGSFVPRHQEEKEGFHPGTGERIRIAARNSVGFRPGKALKAAVNCPANEENAG